MSSALWFPFDPLARRGGFHARRVSIRYSFGMLFHIQVPFYVFSVRIGNFSDLCHHSPPGLNENTMNISAWTSAVSLLSSFVAMARPHGTVNFCLGDKISARDSGK